MSQFGSKSKQNQGEESKTSNVTASLYSNSQISENFDAESTVSLNNQVSLVLKDYEQSVSTSSMPKFEESSNYCSSSDEDHIDQRLKHIEETAKKGLSKYFEKNVLKFKIKLTFDEPVYLTNDIYMNELSMQDTDTDIISIRSNNTETFDEATETSVTYELEGDDDEADQENLSVISIQGSTGMSSSSELNASNHTESNVRLGLCTKSEKTELQPSNVEVFNKLSDLVDLFVTDDVEEDVEVVYEEVETVDEVNTETTEIALETSIKNSEDSNQVTAFSNVAFGSEILDTPLKEFEIVHRNLKIENFEHLKSSRKSENLESLKLENFQHLSSGQMRIIDFDEEDVQVEYRHLNIESSNLAKDTLLKSNTTVLTKDSEIASNPVDYLSRSIDLFIQDEKDEDDSPRTESFVIDYPVKDCVEFKRSANVIKTGTDNDIEYLRKLSEIVDIFSNDKI